MNITEKYGCKILYDQFGRTVHSSFYDVDEIILIDIFESCVLDLKKENKSIYNMIELGSNQAYYSLLFNKILNECVVNNILVEPNDDYINRGVDTFKHNDIEGTFINKSIGDIWVAHNSLFNKDVITVDELIDQYSIDILDVLHSDIDGAEITMLEGSKNSLKYNKIKYAFILAHGENIFNQCIDFISDYEYDVIHQYDEQIIGADRLIVIKSRI